MLKKTVAVLSVAALTGVGALSTLPQASAKTLDQGGSFQIAACNPCNPCAAKKASNPCNPCAAKKGGCNPCNPCAAKKAGANPCNPCAAKKK